LRQDDTAFSVRLGAPTALNVGDKIEIAGFPEMDGFSASVVDAELISREPGPPPTPVEVNSLEKIVGLHDVQLIRVTATLAVGPSGAGKAARVDLLASEIMGSANPYAVGHKHRHIPEILQNMRKALGGAGEVSTSSTSASLTMTPVIVPMARGILAVVTAVVAPGVTAASLHAAYAVAYGDERFVNLLPLDEFPRSGDTLGANTCLVGLNLDEKTGRATIITALDNLTKGTAGAAIQSANIALGLPEGMGLSVNGVAP
jgi:N-acetyl-gamma-glutamyl-phosphate reductase